MKAFIEFNSGSYTFRYIIGAKNVADFAIYMFYGRDKIAICNELPGRTGTTLNLVNQGAKRSFVAKFLPNIGVTK